MPAAQRLTLPVLILLFAPQLAHAQGGRVSGYTFSAWEATQWNAIEWRARCDGGPVSGVDTGPIKWTVQYRTRAQDLVSFDYSILTPDGKEIQAKGRAKLKPKGVFERLATLTTSRCDQGLQVMVGKVRFGADTGSAPYAQPDRRG